MNAKDYGVLDAAGGGGERNEGAVDDIAVVGIGCRFPGKADGPDLLWRNLIEGRDCISEVPDERWHVSSFFNPRRGVVGKSASKWGGFVEGIDRFDAEFFGISPREAALMDPQQRMLLEVCWEALEDAGCVPSHWHGRKVGVYVGGFTLDYMLMQLGAPEYRSVEPHTATGSMMTLLSNRLSYVFGFNGPSLSVDTACSSSLVAVHLACNSLRSGESELALAGGASALLGPGYTVAESRAGMLSPTGRSRAFDSRADGYVRGEGAGLVVLKPLRRAVADGDHVYAVICATAVNQDGHSEGLTVPSGDAQKRLLREAYGRAGIAPGDIAYMEAHGTGTPVGDPIEANALGSVLSEGRDAGAACFLGSIKTNIGHTEAAAGVAGLIKSALVLERRTVPPHLHLQQANPKIDFAQLKLQVAQQPAALPAAPATVHAGVNSFGFGGTNAHAVLRSHVQAHAGAATDLPTGAWVLPVSARDGAALRALALAHAERLEQTDETTTDLCYTAATRREHHPLRLAAVGATRQELIDALRAAADQTPDSDSPHGMAAAGLAFVYTGMGPQWWGMGQALYRSEPAFRASVERCAALFQARAGWSILEAMLADEQHSRMAATEVSQPANFIVQVALTDLLASWGIRPAAIVGHSAGEPAACYAAGALSLDDAVTVIYHRSRLQQRTTGQGGMLAVGEPEDALRARLAQIGDATLSIAAINGPASVTVVGSNEAIADLQRSYEGSDVFVRALRVSVPYHSCFMDPYRDEMLEVLSGLRPRTAAIPRYSTVTGTSLEGSEVDAAYWFRNVRQPVQFERAFGAMAEDGYHLFLEIGPHPVLASAMRETAGSRGIGAHMLHCLRRDQPEALEVRRALAALYAHGIDPVWDGICPAGRFVPPPPYPWQRQRYWHELPAMRDFRRLPHEHALLGRRLDAPQPVWEVDLENPDLAFIADHRIQGTMVFPGAGYMEMAAAAARSLFGSLDIVSLADIRFVKALYLDGEAPQRLRISVDTRDHSFQIVSRPYGDEEAAWTLHCAGNLRLTAPRPTRHVGAAQAPDETLSQDQCYQNFQRLGLEYGPSFRGIHALRRDSRRALAEVRLPDEIAASLGDFHAHPALLDLCFQTLAGAIDDAQQAAVYMPVGVGEWRIYGSPSAHMHIHATLAAPSDDQLQGDVVVVDDSGKVCMELSACRARAVGANKATVASAAQGLYAPQWREEEAGADVRPADATTGTWLLLGGDEALRAAVHARLAEQNQQVVVRTTELTALSLNEYGPLRGVIDLTATASPANEAPPAAAQSACLRVLNLTKALADRAAEDKPRLWIVTREAQAVDGSEQLDAAQAALWGLARVLGHAEHIDLWGGIVDIDRGDDDAAGGAVADACLAPRGEDQLAWRNGRRYILRLAGLPASVELPVAPSFRPDASYLLTGGLGALGVVVARWMIERGARHLILLGREALPPRESWAQLPAEHAKFQRVSSVRALEAAGAHVRVEAVDVSDAAAVARAIAAHEDAGYPPIRGVIHSAGVAVPQLLSAMSDEEFIRVLRPKVDGAWNLHRALEGRELDFFILFSSVAALVTSAGQGNYAAGNAFLDGLAYVRRAQGLPALSVGWGPWGEVGMAAELNLLDYFTQRGLLPMSTRDGLDALGRLMSGAVPQAVVLNAQWQRVAESSPLGKAPPLLAEVLAQARQAGEGAAGGGELDLYDRIESCADPAQRLPLVHTHLLALVGRVLRIDQSKLRIDESLTTRGLDSMMAIELKNRIERDIGAGVAVVDLLRGMSVAALADLLWPAIEARCALGGQREMAELVDSLGQLSADELAAMLAADTETAQTETVQ